MGRARTKEEDRGTQTSSAVLRLARVALGVNQREAAIVSEIGWRSMQRLELDEQVGEEIRDKVQKAWEQRGIAFLKSDDKGWGIRVRKLPVDDDHVSFEALRALRTGLAMSVEEAAEKAGVPHKLLNRLESGHFVEAEIWQAVTDAYKKMGVKFLPPTSQKGWGFRIPDSLSPEHGDVLLIRPRRGSGGARRRA